VRSLGGPLRARIDEVVTPEAVREAWSRVTDMSAATRIESIQEASGMLVTVLDQMKANCERSSDGVSYGKQVLA
jgi:3-hydroxyacyl-CoA dehydrogenase/3a,7a,12a-trihydroxy-5b-cholest-24-enoyl-CoA hydratase